MKVIDQRNGISNMLNTFRKLVNKSNKITFVGCPGFCTPFAELLAYVIRNKNKEMVFVPNLDYDKAKRIDFTEYGMQLSEYIDAIADTVVLLGGLAMPRIGVNAKDAKNLVKKIAEKNCSVIGVCFMNVFEKYGWDTQIDFDYIINADMVITTYASEE
ncbi:MAG: DUF2124 family protein [Methanosarcinales archaeon]